MDDKFAESKIGKLMAFKVWTRLRSACISIGDQEKEAQA